MDPWFIFSIPTLAVSAIYCIWKAYFRVQQRLQQIIRGRVTYMLWVVANQREFEQARREHGLKDVSLTGEGRQARPGGSAPARRRQVDCVQVATSCRE
jgi:hypothetical protein